VLTNDDLAQMVDTNDEWIRDRVGIATRRIAAGDETVADMAAAAAEKALAGSGLAAADIDLVVVATCSSVDRCPNVATRVAHRLGINAPGAYDINTACSGFSYALATVDHAIAAGASRHAIVIGAEKLSDVVDWTDRSTAIIFGDGAGAAVVSATADGEETGIGPVIWGSAPEKGDAVRIEGWRPYIQQEGQAVFRWATTKIAPVALRAIELAGLTPADIDVFVPHQANLRIVEAVAKRLRKEGAREDMRVADDIVHSGNTSSASIPLALDHMRADGRLRSGDTVLLVGFGAGLSYAGQVVVCP
jgi:3-oxoacyl-[acyl-carrier-protein] synthase-3